MKVTFAVATSFVKVAVIGIIFGVGSSFAAAFDVIVPAEVVARTPPPGIVGYEAPFGWIVATDAPCHTIS